MKDDWLSSATRITDERAAAALSDPMLRRLVLSFVQVPRSIGEIAAESQIDIKRLHHHVTRLCQIGLLKVVGKRRRPGRAIKLYGASAEAFFIPFEVAPELFTEGLSRECGSGYEPRTSRRAMGCCWRPTSKVWRSCAS